MDRKPLPTWVHPKGRLVLLGDACHPMLVCDAPSPSNLTRWVLILFPSHTAPKAPQSQSKTQQSSGPYYRTSHHSHKSPLFSKPTKTSGERHFFLHNKKSLTPILEKKKKKGCRARRGRKCPPA
jgi:hypothetical protein